MDVLALIRWPLALVALVGACAVRLPEWCVEAYVVAVWITEVRERRKAMRFLVRAGCVEVHS